MMELSDKEKHKRHREKNLLAKHLRESGLYKLKVIKPKVDEYRRKKITVKEIERIIIEEE